jgi:ribosomal protein S18 acetylase RimI-like enzyme
MTPVEPLLRSALPSDAVAIAALAIQVFLDTYATEGVRADLAREAFSEYGADAFARRLEEPARHVVLAEQASALVGFAEVRLADLAVPGGVVVGAELVRLYIQPRVQRQGLGRSLLQAAEQAAQFSGLGAIWLTAWEGNHHARQFYGAQGYQEVGTATCQFEGHTYTNRVMSKALAPARGRGLHADRARGRR